MSPFALRLPEQPIFQPVTNRDYATQIARDRTTKSGSRAGHITQFAVGDECAPTRECRAPPARLSSAARRA
jgi:hypothetical protein